jgi:hypothetical protein
MRNTQGEAEECKLPSHTARSRLPVRYQGSWCCSALDYSLNAESSECANVQCGKRITCQGRASKPFLVELLQLALLKTLSLMTSVYLKHKAGCLFPNLQIHSRVVKLLPWDCYKSCRVIFSGVARERPSIV